MKICICNWQNNLDAILCLCWGVLILGFLLFLSYFILRYVVQPWNKHRFEKKTKKEQFVRELLWDKRKEEKTQIQQKIDKLEKQLKDLKEAVYLTNNED